MDVFEKKTRVHLEIEELSITFVDLNIQFNKPNYSITASNYSSPLIVRNVSN